MRGGDQQYCCGEDDHGDQQQELRRKRGVDRDPHKRMDAAVAELGGAPVAAREEYRRTDAEDDEPEPSQSGPSCRTAHRGTRRSDLAFGRMRHERDGRSGPRGPHDRTAPVSPTVRPAWPGVALRAGTASRF
ncbi:MAG: hypothetical protein M3N46_01210 [Actinomycetota bacterium]|nr:hypothetical protein [Actinomycetota bacterium]